MPYASNVDLDLSMNPAFGSKRTIAPSAVCHLGTGKLTRPAAPNEWTAEKRLTGRLATAQLLKKSIHL